VKLDNILNRIIRYFFLLARKSTEKVNDKFVMLCLWDRWIHSLSHVLVGNIRRRQDLCRFPSYIVYWNVIEIIFQCSRSIYDVNTRNLWYARRRTCSHGNWVRSCRHVYLSVLRANSYLFVQLGRNQNKSENIDPFDECTRTWKQNGRCSTVESMLQELIR
jgi:hypothetical protein